MGSMHGVYSCPRVAGGVPGVCEGPGPRDGGQPAAPRQCRHRREQDQHGGHDRAAPGEIRSRFLTFNRYFHMQAVQDNNLALVRLLVSHGSDVNIADTDSWTPLHAAAANGHHGGCG